MQIVKTLTREDLESIARTGEIAYAESEASFLSRHAPNSFGGKLWEGLWNDESLRMEAAQRLFEISVKLDICVYRGTLLEPLAKEKAGDANPLLKALGIEEVAEGDAISMLYNVKRKCLDGLAALLPKEPLRYSKIEETGGFDAEREELHAMFGKTPIAVYGSALTKSRPGDIDTMVILPEFNEGVYRAILGKCDQNREPPLSIVILPAEYVDAFTMADTDPRQRWSKMISGSVELPEVSAGHRKQVWASNAAIMYTRVRKALLPERLDSVRLIHRLNFLLKQPKFICRALSDICGEQLAEPGTNRFKSLPPRNEMVHALAEANMSAYGVMEAYQAIKKP